MTMTVLELAARFTGAATAAKLIDHRTPQAMALLKEHHFAENTHDIPRITNTYGEHSRMVFNHEAFNGLEALEKAHVAARFGIQARHVGQFGDIPPTGRLVEFPAVGIYTFDVNGKLVQEDIMFDTGGITRQLTA